MNLENGDVVDAMVTFSCPSPVHYIPCLSLDSNLTIASCRLRLDHTASILIKVSSNGENKSLQSQ